MTKTQIQLPDELYRRVKKFSADREWSMAETFRRGVEQLLLQYPEAVSPSSDWQLPSPRKLGCRNLSHRQIHEAALGDMEPRARRGR